MSDNTEKSNRGASGQENLKDIIEHYRQGIILSRTKWIIETDIRALIGNSFSINS